MTNEDRLVAVIVRLRVTQPPCYDGDLEDDIKWLEEQLARLRRGVYPATGKLGWDAWITSWEKYLEYPSLYTDVSI